MSTKAPVGGLDRRNIEAIHPLTPMQSSLLFAALRAGRGGADPGFLQVRCTIRGNVDEPAFEAAWNRVIERHAALRTSIHWQNVDRPLQVVARRTHVSWTVADLRDREAGAQDRHIEAWLAQDQAAGIDLTCAPVLRLARFRRTDETWSLVLSCHHVLLDGWSGAILLDEATAFHDAFRQGREPDIEASRPFSDYVRWLLRQDQTAAETYWRDQLGDATGCATLPFPIARNATRHDGGQARVSVFLDELRTAALQSCARSQHLTAGSLVSAAWAVLLASRSGNADVCFGTTVSGRAASVPGMEGMVGTLINALPVRALVARDATVRAFLHDMQRRLVTMRRFEHTPPDSIQEWSGVRGRQRVFDSLVVFENFPTRSPAPDDALRIEDLRGGVTTTAPLTLVAAPGPRLELHLLHDASRIGGDAAGSLLADLVAILDAFVDEPDSSLAAVTGRTTAHARSAGTEHPGVVPWQEGRANGTGATQSARAPAAADGTVDPLELQLLQIFESVLRVHPIGVRDDFFALGGHSLVAARLFDRIENVLGRRLPLATLFEASTVEALAARLRSGGWRAPWSSLVAMQPEGALPALFCVHSYEGHILHYRDLARRLAPDQPVYGLQSVGLDGARPPLGRVEEMAAHYLAEIRTVQPEGPYLVAGMCFGIAVAFEMAQQLVAHGQDVDRLFILDSGFLHFLPPQRRPDRPFVRGALWRIAAHGRGLRYRAARLVHHLKETEHAKNLRRVRESNERAWWRYQPRPYPGSITLLRSEAYGSRQDWHIETWSRLVAGIETHVVPGDHTSLIHEPHVEHLADRVRSCLSARVPA